MQARKYNLISVIVCTIFIVASVIAAAFAYFTVDTSGVVTNISFTSTIGEELTPVFISTWNSETLSVYGSSASMMPQRKNNLVDTESSQLNVSLIAGSESVAGTCTFSFIWEDESTDTYVPAGDLGSELEYTLKIMGPNSTTLLAETNMDAVKTTASANSGIIASSSITSNGVEVIQSYYATVSLYNTSVAQYIGGKKFACKVTIGNINCS